MPEDSDLSPGELARSLARIETALGALQIDVTAMKLRLERGDGRFALIEADLGTLKESRGRVIGAIITLGIGVLSALAVALLGDFIHLG